MMLGGVLDSSYARKYTYFPIKRKNKKKKIKEENENQT